MDSSEEEETHNISAFSKFDESIDVRNAEEIKSPVNSRPTTMKSRSRTSVVEKVVDDLEVTSPRGKRQFGTYSGNDNSFEKVMGLGSDPSDSEETDDDDIQGSAARMKSIELYDPKKFEDLEVSTEVRELFQNITRSVPRLEIAERKIAT